MATELEKIKKWLVNNPERTGAYIKLDELKKEGENLEEKIASLKKEFVGERTNDRENLEKEIVSLKKEFVGERTKEEEKIASLKKEFDEELKKEIEKIENILNEYQQKLEDVNEARALLSYEAIKIEKERTNRKKADFRKLLMGYEKHP